MSTLPIGRDLDRPVRVAAVQLEVALGDVDRNLAECERLARAAARGGARLIALPEIAGRHDKDLPTMWENALYVGGDDDGVIDAGAPVLHAANCGRVRCPLPELPPVTYDGRFEGGALVAAAGRDRPGAPVRRRGPRPGDGGRADRPGRPVRSRAVALPAPSPRRHPGLRVARTAPRGAALVPHARRAPPQRGRSPALRIAAMR